MGSGDTASPKKAGVRVRHSGAPTSQSPPGAGWVQTLLGELLSQLSLHLMEPERHTKYQYRWERSHVSSHPWVSPRFLKGPRRFSDRKPVSLESPALTEAWARGSLPFLLLGTLWTATAPL